MLIIVLLLLIVCVLGSSVDGICYIHGTRENTEAKSGTLGNTVYEICLQPYQAEVVIIS